MDLTDAVVQAGKYAVPLPAPLPLPLPADEEERLGELLRLNLLDTDPEDAFDRVTRKLARVFDVSLALITFVDRDRQFFKSHVGLPPDLVAARSTPRAVAVCGHVVASDAILVVEDLARDARFAHNPLLRARKLRFYAGVPLHSPNGRVIGSLCILDIKPRQISEREKRLLLVIAEEVNELIGQRAALSTGSNGHSPHPGE